MGPSRDPKVVNLAEKRAEKRGAQRTARPVTHPTSPVARPTSPAPTRPTSPAPARPTVAAPAPARPTAPAPARPTSPAPARPTAPAPTPIQKGAVILREKEALQKAQEVVATTRSPAVKALAERETAVRTVRLQQIIKASKEDRGEKKPTIRPPVTPRAPHQRLPPVVAVTRQHELTKQVAQKATEVAQLREQQRFVKDPRAKNFLNIVAAQRQAEIRQMKDRAVKLDKGVDVYRPPRLPAHVTPKARVPLALPKTHIKPSPVETKKLVSTIIRLTPRLPGETEAQYKARLYALSQRAVTRWAQHYTKWYIGEIATTPTNTMTSTTITAPPSLTAPTTTTVTPVLLPGESNYTPPSTETVGDTVIVQIAEQTVKEDGATIQNEVASGGVASDPVADDMANTVDQAADVIDAATGTDTPPADDVVIEAEAEAAKQMEEVDKTAVPIYKQPAVLGIAVAGIAYWLAKRYKWI